MRADPSIMKKMKEDMSQVALGHSSLMEMRRWLMLTMGIPATSGVAEERRFLFTTDIFLRRGMGLPVPGQILLLGAYLDTTSALLMILWPFLHCTVACRHCLGGLFFAFSVVLNTIDDWLCIVMNGLMIYQKFMLLMPVLSIRTHVWMTLPACTCEVKCAASKSTSMCKCVPFCSDVPNVSF